MEKKLLGLQRINEVEEIWNIKGFIDDDPSLWDKTVDDYPVYGAFLLG